LLPARRGRRVDGSEKEVEGVTEEVVHEVGSSSTTVSLTATAPAPRI
jgi:hypothetical protein